MRAQRLPAAGHLRRYLLGVQGAAASELALWLPILILPLLNVVDIGFYIFQRMQVENAAATAAHSAWVLCYSSSQIPATKNCSNLTTTVQSAVQQTSLTSQVSLDTAHSYENYFCADNTGALNAVGTQALINSNTAPTLPSQFTKGASSACSVLGGAYAANTSTPGDYLVINVTYTTVSLFPGATVTRVFGPSITGSSLVRLL